MKIKIIVAICLLLLLIVMVFPTVKTSFADEFTDKANEDLDNIDLSPFEELLEKSNAFSGKSFKEEVKALLSGKGVDGERFINKVVDVLFSELKSVLPIFVALVGIILLFGVLGELKDGYLSDEIKNIINLALMLAVMIVILGSVTKLVVMAKETMGQMKNQMFAAFPVLLTLLFAVGGKTSAAGFQPILYFLSVIISDVIVGIVFPLFILSLSVNLLSSVSDNVKLGKFSDFLKSISSYIIGISLTVFVGVIAITGLSAGTYDSIIYKTAKYAVGTSVPVVGSYIKDGLDLIILSSVALKNSVGIVSMILFVLTALSPIISVYLFSIMLNFLAGITESFASAKLTTFLGSAGKSVSFIGSSLLAVTFMYLVSVFALILVGNSFV